MQNVSYNFHFVMHLKYFWTLLHVMVTFRILYTKFSVDLLFEVLYNSYFLLLKTNTYMIKLYIHMNMEKEVKIIIVPWPKFDMQ